MHGQVRQHCLVKLSDLCPSWKRAEEHAGRHGGPKVCDDPVERVGWSEAVVVAAGLKGLAAQNWAWQAYVLQDG